MTNNILREDPARTGKLSRLFVSIVHRSPLTFEIFLEPTDSNRSSLAGLRAQRWHTARNHKVTDKDQQNKGVFTSLVNIIVGLDVVL